MEVNNKTPNKIDLKQVREVAENFLYYYHREDQEVSIAFVGDQIIKKLNQAYRNTNKPTDVLAFPGEDGFLGELVIDYAQIKRQAPRHSANTQEELIFILVHGLLHLLGYKDDTAEKKQVMINLGEDFIKHWKKSHDKDKKTF